ncbi:hypothetical protein BJX61DRAFT_546598 [Aspergillus egyptiacus]|nr:hypothetical protein BJX61DRAFT_546598 [Aspergillus egyptiacus]
MLRPANTLCQRVCLRPLILSARQITTTRPALSPSFERDQAVLEKLERDILSPERAETTCSGTDNAVGDDVFSYDPSVTNPELELENFEQENRGNGAVDPLFISPANPAFSQLLARERDGRCVDKDRCDRSGVMGSVRGWVNKHKEVKMRALNGAKRGAGDAEFERLLRGLRRVQMER